MNKKGVVGEKLFFARVPAMVWQGLFFFLPTIFLVVVSFVKFLDYSGFVCSFSFDNYRALFDISHFKIWGRSLFLATTNSFLCILISYPIAYFVAIKSKKWKNILLFLLIVPFLTNFLVLAYSWYFIIGGNGVLSKALSLFGWRAPFSLLYNIGSVLLVMVYCYLPFMTLPIYTSLEKIDRSLLEASSDLGASYFQTFIKIIFPLSFSGIKIGFLLVFISSFGEFIIPTLFGGGKQVVAGMLVSYYFLQARNTALGAAFAVASCVVLLSALVFWWLFLRYVVRFKERS